MIFQGFVQTYIFLVKGVRRKLHLQMVCLLVVGQWTLTSVYIKIPGNYILFTIIVCLLFTKPFGIFTYFITIEDYKIIIFIHGEFLLSASSSPVCSTP